MKLYVSDDPQVAILKNQVANLRNNPPHALFGHFPDQHQPDLNAGSKDPGIFYAPNEKSVPASIILKPLKNLDPEMVVNPDLLKKKR